MQKIKNLGYLMIGSLYFLRSMRINEGKLIKIWGIGRKMMLLLRNRGSNLIGAETIYSVRLQINCLDDHQPPLESRKRRKLTTKSEIFHYKCLWTVGNSKKPVSCTSCKGIFWLLRYFQNILHDLESWKVTIRFSAI